MGLPKIDNEVPQVSASTATDYVRKMVGLEELRSGNQEQALRKLAQDYHIGFWQLTHLFKARAKTCDIALYSRIRSAYYDHAAKMIAALQHDLDIDREVNGGDDTEDLVAEAAALAAKVAAKRTSRKPGREVR